MSLFLLMDQKHIPEFCHKWKIKELSLFGSVLREDFSPQSDVDLMVTFKDESSWGLFDMLDMEDELSTLLGRKVDLVTRKAIERSQNTFRRKSILESTKCIYESN